MNVLIAAGGTGGHIIPAIAVADELAILSKSENGEDGRIAVTFVGTGKPLEEKLVGGAGYTLRALPTLPFSGKGIKGKLRLLTNLPSGIRATHELLRQLAPRVVIGFGGYPSFLPVYCAWRSGIPIFIEEQNAKAGVANRLLSLIARKVFAVPQAHGFLKASHVEFRPNPVRRVFHEIPPWRPPGEGEKWRVLIVGGSQGAVSMNRSVIGAIESFRKHGVEIVHQSGETDLLPLSDLYRSAGYPSVTVRPFIDSIATEYAQAHLVICRAGAMTAAEVSAAGRPAIYVPLPLAGGHQAENVRHLVERGAALMFPQDEALSKNLTEALDGLLANPSRLEGMAARAHELASYGEHGSARRIAEVLFEAAKGQKVSAD